MKQFLRGFTLVELLIVIAIISILVAIIFPNFTTSRTDAKNKAMRVALKETQLALEVYRSQYDQYPSDTTWQTDLVPDFIAEVPQAANSANPACTINYVEDGFFKLTAEQCIGGASSPTSGVQPDDELARCPDYCGSCTTSGYTQSDPEFYESIAVYSAGGECD